MTRMFRAFGIGWVLLAVALGGSSGCILSGAIAQITSENPASPEPLSFLAINGFYIPFKVAQNQGIDTPEELERALRTEKIPYFSGPWSLVGQNPSRCVRVVRLGECRPRSGRQEL
jgi:hypothetical protein